MPPEFLKLPLEWQKTIRELVKIAATMEHGEITIKVHERKSQLTEYTVKRKTQDVGDFTVRSLEELE